MLDKQVACLHPCGTEATRKRPNEQRTGWRLTPASRWGLVAVHPLRAFKQQTGVGHKSQLGA